MNDTNKTPRKLTSDEFHRLTWNLQKRRSILEHKIDDRKKSMASQSSSLKEYHECQIRHLKEDIAELTMLIDTLQDNRRALYDLPKSDA